MEKEKDYYNVEEASELCYTTKQTIYLKKFLVL